MGERKNMHDPFSAERAHLLAAQPLLRYDGEETVAAWQERARGVLGELLGFSAFRRADELAVAMECRCYHGDEGRTRMKQLAWCTRDTLAMVWSALVLAGVIVLARFGL